LHRDSSGSMSIVSVFAVMLMVMLLGMVMNAGREVDGKIRMQNAADAAAYSGGLVLARGMNTLAFTNHLLCEVFAMTAMMKEAQEGNAKKFVSDIIDAWSSISAKLSGAGSSPSIAEKFSNLGSAISEKIAGQQEMVELFSQWAKTSSEQILPVLQYILDNELIPEYQRLVVNCYPEIAQDTASEVAKQNGDPDHGRGQMYAALWSTEGTQLASAQSLDKRSLPVIDPVNDPGGSSYQGKSREQRYTLSHHYLRLWNSTLLTAVGIGRQAQMCQFLQLWDAFTCAHLNNLLEANDSKNLLFMIKNEGLDPAGRTYGTSGSGEFDPYPSSGEPNYNGVTGNILLNTNFSVVSVVYWKQLSEMSSTFMGRTLFKNPSSSDAVAFAEARFFVPRKRRVWAHIHAGGSERTLPGFGSSSRSQSSSSNAYWAVVREGVPEKWSLLTQNWTAQLVPTKGAELATILTKQPTFTEGTSFSLTLPTLNGIETEQLERISPH
jgi:hypothetical protein